MGRPTAGAAGGGDSVTNGEGQSRARSTFEGRVTLRLTHIAGGSATGGGSVSFVAEAFDTPVCWIAVIEDPDGDHITIHKRHIT